ncbi:MAG: hypothetical protein EXS10_01990 [Phycisphaerales bacterium]|nr:hypothetical protein [Phycisphaerales bacterium]
MISLLIAASTLATPSVMFAVPQQSSSQLSAPLANLQMEYNALGSVTDTAGRGTRDANKRVELMKSFMATNGLADEFAKTTFTAPKNPGLTFMQAYQVALRQAQLAGTSVSSGSDISTLAREVGAQSTLAQDSFTKYQAALASAGQGIGFLQSKGQLDAYYKWAATSQADKRNARLAQEAALRAKTDAAAQALEDANVAAARRLQLAWDEHPIITDGNDYSWQPSQFNPANENNGGGTSNNYSSGNGLPNYWQGSYEGGYADPYYDVNGFPNGVDPNRNANHRSSGGGRGSAGPIAPPSAPAAGGQDHAGHDHR